MVSLINQQKRAHIMRRRITSFIAVALSAVGAINLGAASPVQAGMQRISVATGGAQANGDSGGTSLLGNAAMSARGRFVAFTSLASNLVKGDTNGVSDVFIRDRDRGTTQLISVSSGGARGNGPSRSPSMSGDGRFVVFSSLASNLVQNDTNNRVDVFVRDRRAGTTRRVSVGSGRPFIDGGSFPRISADGQYLTFVQVPDDFQQTRTYKVYVRDLQTNKTELASVGVDGKLGVGFYFGNEISADGRYVAFYSDAATLVPPDGFGSGDVFVRDLHANTIERANRALDGSRPNGGGRLPELSADGRYVAFSSEGTNLVAGDSNSLWDIFVFDRQTATTRVATLSTSGAQANDDTIENYDLSADGRYVAFSTRASNLVPGVTGSTPQIYLRDLQANATLLVSAGPGGAPANGMFADFPVLSQHGRVVAFSSDATNLVPRDTNGVRDVFVKVYPATAP